MERQLHGFGKTLKYKNSDLIPVQTTAIQRRKYRHRGRGQSSNGRRPKDVAPRSQMNINENDDGIVYHTFFPQKKQLGTKPNIH